MLGLLEDVPQPFHATCAPGNGDLYRNTRRFGQIGENIKAHEAYGRYLYAQDKARAPSTDQCSGCQSQHADLCSLLAHVEGSVYTEGVNTSAWDANRNTQTSVLSWSMLRSKTFLRFQNDDIPPTRGHITRRLRHSQ